LKEIKVKMESGKSQMEIKFLLDRLIFFQFYLNLQSQVLWAWILYLNNKAKRRRWVGKRSVLTTNKRKKLEALFHKHNCRDFKWIEPEKIVVSQWVRMKCMFGCPLYGQKACCPPNMPTVSECERFFREYTDAVVFHFEKKLNKPEDLHTWSKKASGMVKSDLYLSANSAKLFLSEP